MQDNIASAQRQLLKVWQLVINTKLSSPPKKDIFQLISMGFGQGPHCTCSGLFLSSYALRNSKQIGMNLEGGKRVPVFPYFCIDQFHGTFRE